jgi:hypothetical protein
MSSIVGDKRGEIDFFIFGESFRIIFESMYFNKIVHWGKSEAEVSIMF